MSLHHIVSVLAAGVLMASVAFADESQRLKPWQDAEGPDLETQWTTAFMCSRPPRQVQTINRDWTFNYFPAAELAEQPAQVDFDDAQWSAVAVPHTWQTYETTGLVHPYMMYPSESELDILGKPYVMGNVQYWWHGWGWYRKHFQLSLTAEQLQEKQVFVEFEAVMKHCRVYLNGQYVGDHKGGYNAFYFNLTPYLKPNGENVLAVAVNCRQRDPYCTPPMYAGNWTYYGGITRDVRLVVKDRLYIPFQGSHLHQGGTFVTTPTVSAERGVCRVRTWVRNDYPDQRSCELVTSVKDAEGNAIGQRTAAASLKPGELKEFDQTFPPIDQPHLWSPDTPYLYKVCSEVRQGDRVADRYESPLGFRWFEWDYQDNWLVLNGKKTHIHGTNYEQEYPWLGEAIPDWLRLKDLKDIRFGLRHNFLRPNIFGQAPRVYDFCDRFGVMLNISQPNIKAIDFSEDVQKQMVQEAVRRNRNRPSVIFWSVGNETPDGADSQWIHDEDDTRIIHARQVYPESYGQFVQHTHANMEMENLLRVTVRGWTDNDVKAAEPPNGQHASNEEWQHKTARLLDASIRGRIDMHNGVMWLYNDTGATRIYTGIPLKSVNPKGWVDGYRVPKYMYFLWRANYVTDAPTVFIHPHPWQEKYLGQKKDIIVDSNCDRVELQVNGRPVATQERNESDFGAFLFKQAPVERGALTVMGVKDGQAARATLVMAGPAKEIRLTASPTAIEAARDEVAIITADVVDEHGVQVQGFNKTIRWRIEGPAKLVGPSRYENDSDKSSADGGVWYIATPISNVIRSTAEPGAITVSAECDGLSPGQIVLHASAPKQNQTVASEPPLSEAGRLAVAVPAEGAASAANAGVRMNTTDRDLRLAQGQDKKWYAAQFDKIVRECNPNLAGEPDLLGCVAGRLARHCANNDGTIVADDYNFIVGQANDALQFAEDLGHRRLPAEFIRSQKAYYLEQIVLNGRSVDYQAILRQWDGIDGDAVAVVAPSEDLTQAIAEAHPSLKLENQQKQRELWSWIASMNTCVDAKTFRVQKGGVVLVPGEKSLRSRGLIPAKEDPGNRKPGTTQ